MPPVHVVFYKEDADTVAIIHWLDGLERKPREKCYEWIERLMT